MVDNIDFVNFKNIHYFNISIPFENHHQVKYHNIVADPKYELPNCRKYQALVI